MRLSRPVVASAVVLTAMAVTGFASGKTAVPETTPVVVETTVPAPAAPPITN